MCQFDNYIELFSVKLHMVGRGINMHVISSVSTLCKVIVTVIISVFIMDRIENNQSSTL